MLRRWLTPTGGSPRSLSLRPRPQTVMTNPTATAAAADFTRSDSFMAERSRVAHAFRNNHHVTLDGMFFLFEAIGATPPPYMRGRALQDYLIEVVTMAIFNKRYMTGVSHPDASQASGSVAPPTPRWVAPSPSAGPAAVGAGILPAATAVQLSGASAGAHGAPPVTQPRVATAGGVGSPSAGVAAGPQSVGTPADGGAAAAGSPAGAAAPPSRHFVARGDGDAGGLGRRPTTPVTSRTRRRRAPRTPTWTLSSSCRAASCSWPPWTTPTW